MLLRDWLYITGKSQIEMARELEIGKGYLSQICKGERRPSRDLAMVIEEYTDKHVTIYDLFYPEKVESLAELLVRKEIIKCKPRK